MKKASSINKSDKPQYEVMGIYTHPLSTKNDPQGGDAQWHSSHAKKSAAISAAKKLSKQKTWNNKPLHEVMVEYRPDENDDPAYHAYFKDGKLSFQIS